MNEPAVKSALEDLRMLDILDGCEAWPWFLDRIQRRADDLAASVLEGDMSSADRENLRQQRIGILAVLQFPGEQRLAQDRNLVAEGFKPGIRMPP